LIAKVAMAAVVDCVLVCVNCILETKHFFVIFWAYCALPNLISGILLNSGADL